MDVVGSEIGQKMRSAIKAKLTELGCYVDDELPDYVMVMVANKRTRSQMEEDLQLFLGTNTEVFVSWLHQVLKKLQEVTISTSLKQDTEEIGVEKDKKVPSRSSSKDPKSKAKKDKVKAKGEKKEKHHKKGDRVQKKKDAKKKEKAKIKKKGVKSHKSKKKQKETEGIRPNVPPLLMNPEKQSEPSITDVFAGQILKNHGITIESNKNQQKSDEVKPQRKALQRNRFPVIDPASVVLSDHDKPNSSQAESDTIPKDLDTQHSVELDEIEAKIKGLKKKLADQLDSMSEDEDFLNIRTEAEELMNDFADDVIQEITITQAASKTPLSNPTNDLEMSPPAIDKNKTDQPKEPELLPQIELQLPKRPMRERLGSRSDKNSDVRSIEKLKEASPGSPERFTPDREPVQDDDKQRNSIKNRLGDNVESNKRKADDYQVEITSENNSKKSRISVLESRENRAAPASVVRVRPRPRPAGGAPASNLLMRAVADAHKSLLNIPPKVDKEPSKVQRGIVLPMRRGIEPQKIVIQVPRDRVPSPQSREHSDCEIDFDTESLADLESDDNDNKNDEKSSNKTAATQNLEADTINIHNPSIGKEKGPQFVVTLDGLDPNIFLAKKLKTEGILDEDDNPITLKSNKKTAEQNRDKNSPAKNNSEEDKNNGQEITVTEANTKNITYKIITINNNTNELSEKDNVNRNTLPVKETSSKNDEEYKRSSKEEKRRSKESEFEGEVAAKKRKASPIVFNVSMKVKRERQDSVSSDITVTTTASSKKYDSVPSLPPEKKLLPCRAFPACRFGSSCAFTHPPCKFAARCTRRNCPYSHPPAVPHLVAPSPVIASHVVPVSNYKSITSTGLPSVCKFYPNCVNPACHFFHPKPCRYGKACINKIECNFYHFDIPGAAHKWRASGAPV